MCDVSQKGAEIIIMCFKYTIAVYFKEIENGIHLLVLAL